MAYNQESEHLDKVKEVYGLDYEPLVEFESEVAKKDKTTKRKIDFSTNSYLFFKENEIMKKDVLNACEYAKLAYFKGEDMEEKAKKFPFRFVNIRVCMILEKYHEQPSLLVEISKFIILHVMDVAKICLHEYVKRKNYEIKHNLDHVEIVPKEVHTLFNMIYILIKIRGAEKVKSYFPHEAMDFEPVLFCLASSNKKTPWESNYVMLVWLSLILLMPFDLKILDSNLSGFFFDLEKEIDSSSEIVQVIIDICKKFLDSTTRTAAAAGVCLGRLFTRTDVKDIGALEKYVDWMTKIIRENKDDSYKAFFIAGLYNSLFSIFKILSRGEVKCIQNKVFDLLFGEGSETGGAEKTTTTRHYKTKVAQRLGISLLPRRECKWLYKRTKKSILDAFKGRELDSTLIQTNTQLIRKKLEDEAHEEEAGLDGDVNLEQLEEIIGYLFDMLQDKDTVIRWSAAKGIATITSRLDLDLANDIIAEIMNHFLGNSENEWHGGLLALGELCMMGLLLPENLPRVLLVLKRGLLFEKNQGVYTSGSNVRDAACYVAWTFARAYEPTILQPYVMEFASNLLLCALYDKEVTCRRAAAAAFQENVGRQGNFPQGIAILTEADYFSLAIRLNSYTKVSLFVGHHEEYLNCFLDHLSTVKFQHIELDIRMSSAAALGLFSPLNPKFMIENILPRLIPLCLNTNFYERHGAILSIAEIILGLAGKSEQHCMVNSAKDSIFLKTMTANEKKMVEPGEYMRVFLEKYKITQKVNNISMIPKVLVKKILEIVENVKEKRLYRGKGGEKMREAVCRLIQNIALAKIKITKRQHRIFMDALDECIKSVNEELAKKAWECFANFSKVYHKVITKDCEKYVTSMIGAVTTSPLFNVRRGYSLGLSAWSNKVTAKYIDKFLECLSFNCKIHKAKSQDDAEMRKFAVQSLKTIFVRGGLALLTKERFNVIIEASSKLMDDYTVDRRGDIGSMVRESTMYLFQEILTAICCKEVSEETRKEYLTPKILNMIIGLLLQQLAEKIDKMRLIAGTILQQIFDTSSEFLGHLPHLDVLVKIFSNKHLRERVKIDQSRIDIKFDISLVDTSFLDYAENENFVYFWNIPQCVFPLISPLIQYPEYSYYLLRGLSLSAGGITLSTHKAAIDSIVTYIDSIKPDDLVSRKRILENFLQAIQLYRRRERFLTPLFNCLAFFYENDELFSVKEIEDLSLEVLKKIVYECMKTKKASKLLAATGLSCSLFNTLMIIRNKEGKTTEENKAFLKESKGLKLISHLLNHEYPKVSHLMSQKLFLLVSQSGHLFLGDEKREKLQEYISGKEWLNIDIQKLEELKVYFDIFFD